MGEYNRVNKYYQLSWSHEFAIIMSFKTDILSISPLSEQMTKGSDAWNINFETLYSGQFMLSTQLMILNHESENYIQYLSFVNLNKILELIKFINCLYSLFFCVKWTDRPNNCKTVLKSVITQMKDFGWCSSIPRGKTKINKAAKLTLTL